MLKYNAYSTAILINVIALPANKWRGKDMNKTILHTSGGDYAIYSSNGSTGSAEVYRGKHASSKHIGAIVLGSIERLPEKGITPDNAEYRVPKGSHADAQVRQQAKRFNVKQQNSYVVIQDADGNLRILPRTISAEDGLTTRIRRIEKVSKA